MKKQATDACLHVIDLKNTASAQKHKIRKLPSCPYCDKDMFDASSLAR